MGLFGIKTKKEIQAEKDLAEALVNEKLEEVRIERERVEKIAKDAEKKRRADERKAKKAAKDAEKAKVDNTPKAKATAAKEPWVEVLSMDIDENDPGNGAFELDWNDIFVARLIKAGYQGKSDQDIVDNWFKTVCRNVLMETFEQEQADPETREATKNKRNLGDGYSEHS